MSDTSSPVTVSTLRKMKQAGERFAVLTAYDAAFARLIEAAGVEVLLVGDSLGMVIQGGRTTVPVSVDDMVYHTRCVSGAARRALVMADMPFMSFPSPPRALDNAARLMQQGGAHMVKLEGAGPVLEVVYHLARQGIPVCGHLGLQPQSVHKLGGYRVQGREPEAAEAMLADALAMQEAGADIVLMECVPAELAARITAELTVPTIGIGAGAQCDGQVLVLYDMLGITPGPRFAQNFMAAAGGDIPAALRAYVEAVKSGAFPDADHTLA